MTERADSLRKQMCKRVLRLKRGSHALTIFENRFCHTFLNIYTYPHLFLTSWFDIGIKTSRCIYFSLFNRKLFKWNCSHSANMASIFHKLRINWQTAGSIGCTFHSACQMYFWNGWGRCLRATENMPF